MPDTAPASPLRTALAQAAAEIDTALELLLPPAEGPEAPLLAAMRYAAIGGGKRLRGFLVLEGARQFGVSRQAALRVAAAIEMLHAYSLVHDDLPAMDDDDLRRGKPTLHRAFDEATAIIAGDALQAQAFAVLADEDTHADPAVRVELVRCLARAAGARGMCGGQMLDMLAEAATEPLDEAHVGRLQLLKTGRLIEFSAEAGAVLGKAPAPQRHALAAYGRDIGAAFQIADDLLDATASADETGKRTGKDAAAGKATLLGILGLERARMQAERLVEQAVGHLDSFGDRAALLRGLATYTIERKS
ncbi:polyprenyl synthetase family protein [Falsiroseomonas selenitidurans]|uniref:Polyprenyl synthetase family protein n=1 Tax=Falsiroseomonas selenitidurans TaxID=2716335 RepID=A0ABX1DYG3_9PROT|nr:farnesyl diphosphate synthase [Falsiroseomonas selenitidurans]NKC29901.1 polyprenyl synthetase family protein [Falsiroseomonas selenitidurans]OYW09070.1 MAG: farnesyl-diphosphate synthase [Rhodospirillales bacterium 12-71-4]